ncbi:hypothetical protein TNCV_4764051 [Trichonephila clavipes]|nr:hypothetical protein TNCV_4764051 [Trichonephila clavipes]
MVQAMCRMQNGSKPSIQMVYEACLRAKATPSVAERLSLPERLAEPERIPTPSAQRPERIPTYLLNLKDLLNMKDLLNL